MDIPHQPAYFVALFLTSASSMKEGQTKHPNAIVTHLARAVDHGPGEAISTMGVFTSKDSAEEFARGDPFVLNGMAAAWSIKPWANILKEL